MDYKERDTENMLLDVEFHDGDISKEEHAQCCWSADEMRPEGGWVAGPRTERPGIRPPRSNAWRIGWAQVTLGQGVNR